MAQIDLGRVVGDTGTSIRYRGDWTNTTEYLSDESYIDTVAHDDCLWICKVTNTNQEPTRDSTYWDMAAAGTGVYASDSTEDPPIDIALNADTLGGQGPSYYAKQADVAKQNKKLWEGTPVSGGQILCDTTGYTVYDFYCTDGLMLRGVKILNTTNGKHYAVLGGSGGAYNGSAYVPAVWYGLIDIYDTHFYLHDVTMYTIQDGQSYSGHQISAIYGVW